MIICRKYGVFLWTALAVLAAWQPSVAQPNPDSLPASFITMPPYAIERQAGERLELSVSAEGTPPLSYLWFHNGIALGATDTVLLFSAIAPQHAGSYQCVVTNAYGSAETAPCSVIVFVPTEAAFGASPTSGFAPLTVTFSDSSAGRVSLYTWYFGDGTTSSLSNPVHLYDKPGTYSVRLVVTGPDGSDSGEKNQFISATSPEVKAAFDAVPLSGPAPLAVTFRDSSTGDIGLRHWNFGDGGTSSDASPVYRYATPGVYTVSLYVQGTGTTDSTSKASYIAVEDPLPIDTVDTLAVLPVVNLLAITARHLGDDSAEIRIDSTWTLDTTRVNGIDIWYGLRSQAEFDPAHTTRISLDSIRAASPQGIYRMFFTDSLLLRPADSAFIAVRIIADGAVAGASNTISFALEPVVPKNTSTCVAQALSHNMIRLEWTGTQSADSIRIWYSSRTFSDRPSITPDLMAISLSGSGTGLKLIENLKAQTTYHFGIEIAQRGLWSGLTNTSRANAATFPAPPDTGDTTRLQTVFETHIEFDSSTNAIAISWELDSQTTDSYRSITATCKPGVAPGSVNDGISKTLAFFSAIDSMSILPGESILFDTIYHVALWLIDDAGNARKLPITETTVRTGSPIWQKVVYFKQQTQTDTVRIFNGRILLRKDSTYSIGETIDTADRYEDTTVHAGLIPAGMGFSLRGRHPSPAFYVGFHITALPQGRSIRQVRIYSDSAGVFFADRGSFVDSVNSLVWTKTNMLDFPLLPMLDTLTPVVNVSSDTASYVRSGQPLSDTVIVSDNSARLSWSYHFARGGEDPLERPEYTGVVSSYRDTLVLTIPVEMRVISPESGLRAFLVVSDGSNTTKVDMSRQALRESSDELATEGLRWVPLRVTASLNSPQTQAALAHLSAGGNWTYDTRQFRLFRWYPGEQLAGESKWVEYSEERSSLFSFLPGNVLWIKTRENQKIDFGPGKTLSLKDTFAITLAAQNWNDISIPFRFDIRLSDILDASGSDADTLQFYSWVRDKQSGTYFSSAVYIQDFPDLNDRDTILDSENQGWYTVFNPHDRAITLKIPPMTAQTKAVAAAARVSRAHAASWFVKVLPRTATGARLSSIYCGNDNRGENGTHRERVYPPALSRESLRAGVRSSTGHFAGHLIGSEDASGGAAFELLFHNGESKAEKLDLEYEVLGRLPPTFGIALLNPQSAAWEQTGTVQVEGATETTRWLVVGTQEYREQFRTGVQSSTLKLGALQAFKKAGALRIRFGIPFGGITDLTFSITNLHGQTTWSQSMTDRLAPGTHQFTWNGLDKNSRPVATGMYVFTMRGKKTGSTETFHIRRPLLYAR